MSELEKLREEGWSYYVGYSHGYRGYVARVYKQREKPTVFPVPGGCNITLFYFSVSSIAETLEEAATKCAQKARTDPDGLWWDGLPVQKIAH